MKWHKQNQQWRVVVGYKWNKKKTTLRQADFYLGENKPEADKKVDELELEWEVIKKTWHKQRASLINMDYPSLDKAFWFYNPLKPATKIKIKEQILENDQQLQSEQKIMNDEDGPTPLGEITLEQTTKIMTDEILDRVGRVGGVSKNYADTYKSMLKCALSGGIDKKMKVSTITSKTVSAYVKHWTSKKDITPIHIKHILLYFRKILQWLHSHNETYLFRMPQSTIKETTVKLPPNEVKTYTLPELKDLYSANTDEAKTFILLGCNAGFCSSEVIHLKKSECKLDDATPHILVMRHKTQNQPSATVIRFNLWPETVKAIKAQMSTAGDYVFANQKGKPLAELNYDYVGRHFTTINDELTYKHVRKTGGSAITRIAISKDVGDIFLQHGEDGVLKYYVSASSAFDTALQSAIDKWGDELRLAGVF